jgi:hypothetical protein
MMRPQAQRARRPGITVPPRRRVWPVLLPLCIVVALAAGWCGLWYYAAGVADRTLAGWVTREASAGRVYSCGSQTISGFPFRIVARCVQAGAAINSNTPPFDVSAQDVSFAAQVYQPTVLVGHVDAPLTMAEPGKPPSFRADWSSAEITVRGLPPYPDSVTVALDHPRLDHLTDANGVTLFGADHAEMNSRIVSGSAAADPVIDTTMSFSAATAPNVHALLAAPLRGEIEFVVRGLKDLAPKPWRDRVREMQASGGGIEIKHLRIERTDAIIEGGGKLSVNANGKLDGLLQVAIAGLDQIIPQLGLDRMINKGIDRLAGNGQAAPAINALDRLVPGLGGIVRNGATASIIDNLNKMGQPTEIDKKPAVILPLRVADGSMYLGMLPLGDLPPLF